MPVVEIHVIEGYDAPVKSRLGAAVTDAVRHVIPAPADAVTIMIRDVPARDYMRGRMHRKGAVALSDPAGIVTDYLAAMEARDLDRARSHLAIGFVMQFPGAAPMHRLEELIDWAKPRYREVRKTITQIDSYGTEHGSRVLVMGTLAGIWPDGTTFADIRFVDRFELEDGQITRQDVWNDIAEVRT